MNGRAHAVAGAFTALPLIESVSGDPAAAGGLALALIGAFAAVFPDIDHPERSSVKTLLGPLGNGLSTLLRALSALGRRTTGTADDRYQWTSRHDPDHRGLTHTLAAGVVFAVTLGMPAILVGWWPVPVVLFTGYLSHLLLDACTKQGVPLLWPLRVGVMAGGRMRRRRWHMVRLARLTSCTWTDWIPTGAWCVLWTVPIVL